MAGRKDSCRITKQYLHADGRRVWGELTLSPMRQIIDITALSPSGAFDDDCALVLLTFP